MEEQNFQDCCFFLKEVSKTMIKCETYGYCDKLDCNKCKCFII